MANCNPKKANKSMMEQNELQHNQTPPSESEEVEPKSQKNPVFWFIVIFLSVLILAGLGYLGRMWYLDYSSEKSSANIQSFHARNNTSPSTEDTRVDNPIDFESLQETNSEIYAWIQVPGTRVDYPIAQSETDDAFYLHHDYTKKYLFAGTIYTEFCNKKDFSDPITLVYGHNMYDSEGTMFTTLHYFEDADFFEEHDTFEIYTPGHILTYQIFSAFKYDNRHIMNSFHFEFDNGDLEEFQNTMLHPQSTLKNTRSGVELDKDSKVVVLSTCFLGNKSVRYLVCGVLVKDEPTK